MTSERGPGSGAAAADDGDDGRPGGLVGVRVAGAVLAAILAALAIAVAVRVDSFLFRNPLDSPIATVFASDGIADREPLGSLLVWAVGPVAAAIAGFRFSIPVVRRVDGAGLWMGASTYLLAIGIAPITFLPAAARQGNVLNDLGVVPFLWLFAAVALGPLLAVCLVAGPVWATILRLALGVPVSGEPSTPRYGIVPILALLAIVLLGWAVVISALGAVGTEVLD